MKENLVEILRQLLTGLRRNLWYTIITTSSYEYNLQAATTEWSQIWNYSISYIGIMVKNGDTIMYSNSKLDYLQDVLCGRLTIHINSSNILQSNGTSEGKRKSTAESSW